MARSGQYGDRDASRPVQQNFQNPIQDQEYDSKDYKKSELCCKFLKLYWKMIFLVVWPLINLWIIFGKWNQGHTYFPHFNPISEKIEDTRFAYKYIFRTMYVFVVMCGYWLTECIPIHITGLIPMFAFPLLNVISSDATTAAYLRGANMTFATSLFLAFGFEYSQLHKRIAYAIMLCCGTQPRRLSFGVITASFLLSMWLLNTAVCAMMCPVIKAVIETFEGMGIGSFYKAQTEEERNNSEELRPSNITVAYYLSICYSAGIGGVGTMIGTATTLLYKSIIETRFYRAEEEIVSFLLWTAFCLPVMFVLNLAAWFVIQLIYFGLFRPNSPEGQFVSQANAQKDAARKVVQDKLQALGSMSWHECWVLFLFIVAILLMIFRKPDCFPGWADGLWLYGPSETKPDKKFTREPVVLSLIVFLMLVIPNKPNFLYFCTNRNKRPRTNCSGLVTWKIIQEKTPWGMIFLIGGGSCLAVAGNETKMTNLVGRTLYTLRDGNKYLVLCITTLIVAIVTQFTSNMTAVNICIPVINELTVAVQTHPKFLGHPAAIMASMAFMLPVATTTNVVAAGYANIKTTDFLKAGSLLLFLSYIILIGSFLSWGRLIFGTYLLIPEWARDN